MCLSIRIYSPSVLPVVQGLSSSQCAQFKILFLITLPHATIFTFYRTILRRARYCHGKLSVRLSVCYVDVLWSCTYRVAHVKRRHFTFLLVTNECLCQILLFLACSRYSGMCGFPLSGTDSTAFFLSAVLVV